MSTALKPAVPLRWRHQPALIGVTIAASLFLSLVPATLQARFAIRVYDLGRLAEMPEVLRYGILCAIVLALTTGLAMIDQVRKPATTGQAIRFALKLSAVVVTTQLLFAFPNRGAWTEFAVRTVIVVTWLVGTAAALNRAVTE